VRDAAEARLARGLATKTEVLLARQESARAGFEVQAAQSRVADSYSRLADTLGISPSTSLRVAELSTLPLPTKLKESVEGVMDRALSPRPDLSARLAQLRAREAEVRRARADFLPTISLGGTAGGTAGQFDAQGVRQTFDYAEPIYSGLLQFSWTLFDGFARENAVRLAEARRGEAVAQLSQLQLNTLRTVWKAYADVQVALLQCEYAKALLDASKDAYDAAFPLRRTRSCRRALDRHLQPRRVAPLRRDPRLRRRRHGRRGGRQPPVALTASGGAVWESVFDTTPGGD
jgi:outer membrane protein TolC